VAGGVVNLGPTNGAQDGTCGVVIDSLNNASYGSAVTAYSLSHGHATNRDTICYGDSIHLRAITHGAQNVFWTGPNGFTSNSNSLDTLDLSIVDSAFYTFSIQICGCWSLPDTVWIIIHNIRPNLGIDIPVCDSTQVVTIQDISNYSHFTYEWNTPTYIDTDTINWITILPSINNCVIVIATDTLHGCVQRDTVCFISVTPDTATVGLAQNCITGCYWPYGNITTNSPANVYQFDFWGQGPPSQLDFNETTFSNQPLDSTNNYWCYGTDWGVYDIAVSITYGAGCVATDTMKLYHYDFTQMAGPDTLLCPTLDSFLIGDRILSTLPLASAAGPGFVINWKHINTGQTYLGRANPWVSLLPGTTNVFELYVLNPYGCDFRDTIYITTCCYDKVGAPPVQIIPANTVIDNSTIIPGFSNVWIQGDVTISGDVLWQNLNVRVAPYAKIVIPRTYWLTPSGPSNYTRLVLDDTKIMADCDTMWTGIEVYGDSTGYDSTWAGLVHYRGSEIMDAIIGIHSIDGGSFIVQKARLLNNHNHITIAPFLTYFPVANSYHPSFLDEAILDCRQPLLFPFTGERTEWAIFINQAFSVTTHRYANTPRTTPYYWPSISYGHNRSYIANADIGINANNMRTEIEMIDFDNITCDPGYSNPCIMPVLNQRPTGIRFQANHTPLYVDDCSFTQCDIGVNTIRTSYSEIKGSNFNNCKQFGVFVQSHDRNTDIVDVHHNTFDAGFIAINSVANNSGSKINVFDNVITNSDRGIQFTFNPGIEVDVFNNDISGGEFGIETFVNNLARFSIHDNTIDNTSRSGVLTRGITLTEPSSAQFNPLSEVVNNRIMARHIGLFLNGLTTGHRMARNRFNTIEMTDNIISTWSLMPGLVSMSNFGAYFLNTAPFARFSRNTLRGPLLYSTGVTDWQNNARGVCMIGTSTLSLLCNEIMDFRDNIQAAGPNLTSRIIRNELNSGRTGLFLSQTGSTGTQGSAVTSFDNEFHCQFTVSALRSENGFGANSFYFYRNTPSTLYSPYSCVLQNTFIPSINTMAQIFTNTATGGIATSIGSPGTDICPGVTVRTSSGGIDEELEQYPDYNELLSALDSIPWDSFDIHSSRKEVVKWDLGYQIYSLIHEHDTFKTLSDRLDSFYLENDELTYGKLRRGLEAEVVLEYEDAVNELASISEDDSIGYLLAYVKLVSIHLQHNIYTWDSIPSDTRDSLISIGELCPFYYGQAVHFARALVSKFETHVFVNECEFDGVDSVDVDSSYTPYVPPTTCLNIFPNPGDEEVTVELLCTPEQEYSIIVVNNLGVTMDEHSFLESEPEYLLDTNAWPQGAYHIILFHNGVYHESRMLAIFH
jgi:hypothetical protein